MKKCVAITNLIFVKAKDTHMLSQKSSIIVLIFCRYFQPTHFSKFVHYLNPLSQNLFLLPLILCYANHHFSLKMYKDLVISILGLTNGLTSGKHCWLWPSVKHLHQATSTVLLPGKTRPSRKFLQSHNWNFLCLCLILFAEVMKNIWG
jgi:hypothetical protein